LRALARQLGADYARTRPGIRDDGSTDDYGAEALDAIRDALYELPPLELRALYRTLVRAAPELAEWKQLYSFESVAEARDSALCEVLELEVLDAARAIANPEDLHGERAKRQSNLPITWGELIQRLEAVGARTGRAA
ncbi:MAG: hypothetical protein AB7G21_09140, partial [Dehalococcoidia bacterium]